MSDHTLLTDDEKLILTEVIVEIETLFVARSLPSNVGVIALQMLSISHSMRNGISLEDYVMMVKFNWTSVEILHQKISDNTEENIK